MRPFFLLLALVLICFLTFLFSVLLSAITQYPYAYLLFLGILVIFLFLKFVSPYSLQDKLSVSEIKLKFLIQDVFKSYFIILGLSLSLISLLLHSYFDFRSATLTTDISTLTYLASVIVLGIGFWRIDRGHQIKRDYSLGNKEKFLFFILVAFVAILRFYKLDSIGHLPEDTLWMEHAFLILERTVKSPFLFVGDLSTNMPAYPVALFYLLNNSIDFATRVPAVIYNLLFLISLFFLCIETFGKKVAFWALAIATFSIWDIHNGRLAWHNLSTNAFLITASLLFFVRSLKYKSYTSLFLCGFMLGLAFNLLYIPALMIGVIGLFILNLFFKLCEKRSIKNLKPIFNYISIILVILFVTIAPTLVKIYKYPDQSLYRHEQFLVHNINEARVRTNSLSYYIEQFNVVNSNFGFNVIHYGSDGPWGPALNPAIIFFFILGLAYSLTRFRSPSFFLSITTWVFMYIPVVILFMTMSVWRLINFAPVVFLFTAIGIVIFIELVIRTIPIFNRNLFEKLVTIGIVLLIGWYIKDEYQQYFYFRTVEGWNHVFQICKSAENQIKELSINFLWVPDDECGRTLYYVFKNKIPVTYYKSIQEPIATVPKTVVLERQKFPSETKILGAQANTRLFLKEEIQDDKSFEKIRLYYLNQ